MTRAEMDACVLALLSVDADVIVVPGDFVTSATEEVYPFAESFSALHAPSGVYGVMGNHDFFAADPDRVAREVNDCGIRLLHNERTLVTKGGGSIALVGIDDVGRPERASAYLRSALRGASPEVPSILLCHRPYFLPQAAEEGIDLVLSGHTHGGQIVFGRFGNVTLTPAQLFSPYVWGHYRHGAAQMFVSRGVGTVGLPMRINCPPEIVVITLSRSRVWQPRG
jgi:predicted MPP superfamily phosphohydrolase